MSVKKSIRKILTRIFFPIIKEAISASLTKDTANSQNSQRVLYFQYKILFAIKATAPKIEEVGLRAFSQHEEDGILLYIYSLIGEKNKLCVEVCAGNGIECNTANLIVNHKWHGLLLDGDESNTMVAEKFYRSHPDTRIWPPKIKCAWITTENINQLISQNGFTGEIDLLSIDIDGIDYWLWKSIEVINPRVVVLEYNHLWGSEKSVSVPYNPNFKAEFTEYGSDYAGASLAAFVKLGKEKGYRLIATNAYSTNAFFIRNDIVHPWLPEIDSKNCFNHSRAKFGIEKRYLKIKDKEWINI